MIQAISDDAGRPSPHNMLLPRVALYARVSTDKQASDKTIDSQVSAIRQRIRQDGLSIPESLCFIDEGYSGSTLLRPALERLRDLAATGVIQRLYILCPDRLSRSYAHVVLLCEELGRCGVEVVFLNHARGKSPENELLLQMQGIVAEYERAKILERSRRGKLHAARRGDVSVLGRAPYGYRYLAKQRNGGQACYSMYLEEAAVVRQIFQWVGAERLSLQEVCRRLQKQGILSPSGKSHWEDSTIWGMLRNPAYIGRAAFGKQQVGPRRVRLRPLRNHPDPPRRVRSLYNMPPEQWIGIAVPAIVDEAIFATVAEQLEENRKRNRLRRSGAKYLLQGLLVCKGCGYALCGKRIRRSRESRPHGYYRCLGADSYRFGGRRICDNGRFRCDLLEEAVWQDVCDLLMDPGRIRQEHERRLKGGKNEGAKRQRLEELIRKVERGIQRLIDGYAEGLLEHNEFEPRVRAAKGQLATLRKEVNGHVEQESTEEQLRLVIGHLESFAERMKASLSEANWQTKRDVIRTLVKEVQIEKEQVRVVYKVDPSPFAPAPDRGCLQHRTGRNWDLVGTRSGRGWDVVFITPKPHNPR